MRKTVNATITSVERRMTRSERRYDCVTLKLDDGTVTYDNIVVPEDLSTHAGFRVLERREWIDAVRRGRRVQVTCRLENFQGNYVWQVESYEPPKHPARAWAERNIPPVLHTAADWLEEKL